MVKVTQTLGEHWHQGRWLPDYLFLGRGDTRQGLREKPFNSIRCPVADYLWYGEPVHGPPHTVTLAGQTRLPAQARNL